MVVVGAVDVGGGLDEDWATLLVRVDDEEVGAGLEGFEAEFLSWKKVVIVATLLLEVGTEFTGEFFESIDDG